MAERPREKLLQRGVDALSDAELLAVVLGSGGRHASVLKIARDLLARFGTVAALLEADVQVLQQQVGLGPAKALLLKAALGLSERYAQSALQRGEALTSASASARFLRLRLRRLQREVFAVLFLDAQHRLIEYEELFYGSLDGASVHPREVVRAALKHNAAAVILSHNHPSGVAEPSGADQRVTERLRAALALIDVRVLDHLIVGGNAVTSMAERGLM